MRDAPDARGLFLGSIFELVAYLTSHSDVPAPSAYSRVIIPLPVEGTDDEQRAQVDHIAQLLGTPIEDRIETAGHYSTERVFGNIVLRAVAITEEHMRRYHAVMSYSDSVTPDTEPAVP